MENRLKYEDKSDYVGLQRYDLKVAQLSSSNRRAIKELKQAIDEVDEKHTKAEIKKLEQSVQVTKNKLTTYISNISQKFKSSKYKSTRFDPVSKEYYEE